jgi:hypothetical protein
MSLTLFLKVLLFSVHHSEFLVLTQNILGMIVSEIKGHEIHTVFLGCTVVVTCPHWKIAIITVECPHILARIVGGVADVKDG